MNTEEGLRTAVDEPHIATTDLRELMGLFAKRRLEDKEGEMADPSFLHTLPTKIKPKHYVRDVAVGEEEHIIHDMIKCCAMLERRWDAKLTNKFSAAAMSILNESLTKLRRPDTWHLWYSELSKVVMNDLKPLAARVYTENSVHNPGDEVDSKDVLQTVGTSRLHAPTQTMVHLWNSAESANMFVNAWGRVWQTVLEYRIEGIFAPFTSMFCFEGTYVSVTCLPPIKIVDRQPVMVPGPSLPSTLLAFSCEQLMRGLFIPKSYKGLSLCHGLDGRYYIISAREILTLRLPSPYPHHAVRTEALMRCTKENKMGNPGEYVAYTLVPRLVEMLAATISRRPAAERNVGMFVATHLFKDQFHALGVNLCQIFEVALLAKKRFRETRNTAYQTIIDICYTEMVGRVLKEFVRADAAQQIANGRDTIEDRLDVCNRIGKFLMGRDPTFWKQHVMPALRLKYNIEDPKFEITHDEAHLAASLKIMSNRIGCEYDPPTGRFNKFVDITSVRMLICHAPEWLVSEQPRTDAEQAAVIKQVWEEVEYSADKAVREAFTARAIVASILLGAELDQARSMVKKAAVAAERPGHTLQDTLKHIRMTSLLTDFPMEENEKLSLIETFLEQLRNMKPPKEFRLLDTAQNTVRMIQCATAIKALGADRHPNPHPFRVELIKEAMKSFVSDKFVDFTFSSSHADGILEAEVNMPDYDSGRVQEYLDLMDVLKAPLRRQHKQLASTKYLQRATWAIVDHPIAEEYPNSGIKTMEAMDEQIETYGYEDPRCALSLFVASLFAARNIRQYDPEMMSLHEQMRKVLAAMKGAHGPDEQLEICRSGATMTIIYRIQMYIDRMGANSPEGVPAHLVTTRDGIEEYLRRFGEPLFAAMRIQRYGRAFMERDYCGWLRKERAARLIERVGRGYIARRLWMFRMYREKVLDQRQRLADLVQRQGRGFIVRKDLKRRQIFKKLLAGAAERHRMRKAKAAIHLLDRIGRGYLGRKLMWKKHLESLEAQAELDRQRRVAEGAERCKRRMADVQQKIAEAALAKIRKEIEDERASRDAILAKEKLIRHKVKKREAKENKWTQEISKRAEERRRKQRQAEDDEDQQLKNERNRPNLFLQRDRGFGDANPLPSFDALMQRAVGADNGVLVFQRADDPRAPISSLNQVASTRPEGSLTYGRFRDMTLNKKDSKVTVEQRRRLQQFSGLPPPPIVAPKPLLSRNDKWAIMFDEERYQRKLITRYMMDEGRELGLWVQYCHQSLLIAGDEKLYDSRMLLRAGVDMGDRDNRAATTIQCCFRSNKARFELRWRVLHNGVHCRKLYAKFTGEFKDKKLAPPLSVMERRREEAFMNTDAMRYLKATAALRAASEKSEAGISSADGSGAEDNANTSPPLTVSHTR